MQRNASSSFRIVNFQNPSGETVHRVTGWTGEGKRIRENYKSHAEAASRLSELEIQKANLETVVLPVYSRLSQLQIQEAERAFAELNGKPLMDAVRFYLENFSDPLKKRSLGEAVEEFLAAKKSANKRTDTLRNLRSRLTLFSRSHGGRMVADESGATKLVCEKLVGDIMLPHVQDFLSRPGLSARAKINDRLALSNFFNWSRKQKYCTTNPAAMAERPETDESKPQILALSDARELIETAATFKEGKLVPYVALCLFCAIRPDGEADVLTWDNIDLKAKTISITGEAAKMRGIRDVEISANCVQWLLPHAAKRTPIMGTNWRNDWDELRELCGFDGSPQRPRAGFKPWVPDYMRHTACTYHLGKTNHEGKTALWAGNSPDTIQKYYRGRGVRKQDIKTFWSISPADAKGKIVRLKAA